MSLMKWEKDESVAILTMTNNENRMNLDFAHTMVSTLEEILEDSEVQALVITSSDEKNFSQGVDVPWLLERKQDEDYQSMRDFMYRMNDVFKALLLYPVPVIAAINGHAFGNGAILSCACDFRFMRSDRGYFCFPEIDVSIPFLPGMISWIRKAIPQYKYNEMALTGKRYTAPELEQHHIILKASENRETLMEDALAFAKTLQKKRGIFGEMKKRMHKHIIDTIDKEDPEYLEPLFIIVQD
jgi:enoyl-CoA hydratase/carnithine racemase